MRNDSGDRLLVYDITDQIRTVGEARVRRDRFDTLWGRMAVRLLKERVERIASHYNWCWTFGMGDEVFTFRKSGEPRA